jgi:SAM-dependent methyltransferase
MSDDRDDEILDLTEEMTAEPEEESEEEKSDPSDQSDAPESPARSSGPPPASPFMLLAKPRSANEIKAIRVASATDAPKREESRPSFVPRESDTPVVTSPVVRLGEGGPSIAPAASPAAADDQEEQEPASDEAAEAAEEQADEQQTGEEIPYEPSAAEPSETDAAGDDADDEILDLSQEFVVDEVSDDDVGSEPIPLVAESVPPPVPDVGPPSEAAEDSEGGEPGDEHEQHVEAAEDRTGKPSEAAAGSEGGQTTADGATDEVEAHPFDFGVPEMVFDTVEEAPPEQFEEADEGEELDEADLEPAEEDEEVETEELDLSEAEDLTPPKKPTVPIPDVGPAAAKRAKGRRRRRKRRAEWWAQIFDDDYVALLPQYTKRDTRRELDFIQKSLGVKSGELVLDLACGGGRHAVGMARRNYRVVGVDISLSMLASAGELAQDAGQKINFIHGDMRDLGFEKTFDGIYCLGTSFGYFDERTNALVLEGVYRALKPGRRFLLETVNRDYVITKQPNLIWFEGDKVVCMEETDFNYITSRIHVNRQIIVGNGERQKKHEFSVRLYSLHEIGQILHHAGFSVIQVGGHPATPGAFFGADSAQMVIVAERRR